VDDRGVGQSTGDRSNATSMDFASDVEAAAAFLKTKSEVNSKKIGLIGHSEGGMIAPIVASKDKSIAFIVLLAGPGVPCDQLLIEQAYLIGKSDGLTETELEQAKKLNQSIYNLVKSDKTTEEVKKEIELLLEKSLFDNPDTNYLTETQKKQIISQQSEQITSPWFRFFMKFNPDVYLSKVKCPVWVVNGDKDLQVPAKMNTDGIQKSLTKAGNKKVTTIIYPNRNHLFQDCTTGSIDEYSTIEQTISPQVLTDISTWIEKQTK
jgi:pimeloyl-ACP methyl ester carboxylesterase